MLLMFEGFDIQTRPQGSLGLNAGGFDDLSLNWWNATPFWPQFADGYQGGQALMLSPSIIPLISRNSSQFIQPSNVMVVSFWARYIANRSGSVNRLITVMSDGTTNGVHYGLCVNANQELALFDNTSILDTENVLTSFAAGQFTNVWRHYELTVNRNTQQITLRVNGGVVLNATSSLTPTEPFARIGLGDGGSPQLALDHLVVSSNSPISEAEARAIAVKASVNRFEGVNTFRGTIILNGERYLTGTQLVYAYQYPLNRANTCTYRFFTNPATGQNWQVAEQNGIEGWGVCFHSNFNNSNRVRLMAVGLEHIDYNGGRPLVKLQRPSSITSFSGPWEKSDPDLTYAAHVWTHPRPNAQSIDDFPSLTIGGPGCMLFRNTPDASDQTPLSTIGITFAEEYRIDNRDWLTIDGEGRTNQAFVNTGYSVLADGDKDFQNNYVTVNYEYAQNGGAYLQGLWDYTISKDNGRWSMRQQIYNMKDGYRHYMRKLKIRGAGRALQLRIESEGDKPFIINGWTMFVTSNART